MDLSNKIIIVTGLPRSGTSFIAKTLHCELGVDMGTEFYAPWPGRDDCDYEDLMINKLLIQYYQQGRYSLSDRTSTLRRAAMDYYALRRKNKRGMYYGFKSPMYLIFNDAIRPKDVFVIKTQRPLAKCLKSVRNLPITETQQNKVQSVIRHAHSVWSSVEADVVIEYKNTDKGHEQIVQQLKEIMPCASVRGENK